MTSSVSFERSLASLLDARGMTPGAVCPPDDALARRILIEYGAIFVAAEDVTLPPACVFTTADQVASFQRSVPCAEARIAGFDVRRQRAALESLLRARAEARAAGLTITPRGGTEAARRSYDDGLRLWESRFAPALAHWTSRGRIEDGEAARLRRLAPSDQVREVLVLEAEEIFFSKDFSKTVLRSVAAPGTSQHLALLAFDAMEFNDARVRELLKRHGWFQTVIGDLPHFTYLGRDEAELPALGLHRTISDGREFWVPNIAA